MKWWSFFYHYIYFHECYRLPFIARAIEPSTGYPRYEVYEPTVIFVQLIIMYNHWYVYTTYYIILYIIYTLFRTTTNICDAMHNSCSSGSWKSCRMSEAASWNSWGSWSRLCSRLWAGCSGHRSWGLPPEAKCIILILFYQREWVWELRPTHIIYYILYNITYYLIRTTTNKKETCGERSKTGCVLFN